MKVVLLYIGLYLIIFVALISLRLIGIAINKLFNYNIFFYFLVMLITIFFPIISLTYCFYINKKEVKKYEEAAKEQYKKKKSYIYYREKIKGYSPGVLAYCYNKKYEFKKIFVATLLNLSLNYYIKFENKKIIILNDEWSKLSKNEQYILELIKNNNLIELYNNDDNKKYWKSLINTEAIETFFLRIKNHKKYEDYYNKLFGILFIGLFIISLAGCVGADKNGEALKNVIIYILTFVCGIGADRIFKNLYDKIYKRNDLAIDISIKLTCIKKFLNEFTTLKDKSIKEVELWEDYMIYVLILDLDGKINNSVNLFIDEYIINN